MLWRLLRAAPGEPPKEMSDEVRPQVERDFRLTKGFDLALQEAGKVQTSEQFAAAAKAEPNSALASGFFTRRDPRTEDWSAA